ncbi:HD domain-containing protein [Kitasatospora azatica]|uniref:hypothetical protein n=1 Tax=Kitasatospora azatica TaxID=58347 RepID=UPI00055DAD6E|nr:hypothetical protein [Kitasatospora azatica]
MEVEISANSCGIDARCKPEPYADQARAYYAAKDPAHDFVHVQRILARLDSLRDGQQPRLHLLYFLACFHGLVPNLDDPGFRRDTAAFLGSLGWPAEEVTQALISLERHLKEPMLLEEELVHDANFLEAVGAFGIAKAFTTGGARGQHYEESIERARFFIDQPVFRTRLGKDLAVERRAYAHSFLDVLEAELAAELSVRSEGTRRTAR